MLIDRQAEAQAKFGVVFEQRVGPRRPAPFGVGGVRRGRQVAAVDRRTAGGVGDQQTVAIELGQQLDVRRFAAAGTGAGILEQRCDQLRSANVDALQLRRIDFRQLQEEVVVVFLRRQIIEARSHVDGLDLRVLAIFRRADLNAQVTAGAIFRRYLQHVFLAAHIARFDIQ